MPTLHIDNHPYNLIKLVEPGNHPDDRVLPVAEVPAELYKRHLEAWIKMNEAQFELRAIYNEEIRVRQDEQIRRQKPAPVPVGTPEETERERQGQTSSDTV